MGILKSLTQGRESLRGSGGAALYKPCPCRRVRRKFATKAAAESPPEAVIFDLGRVLLHFDFSRAATALSSEDVPPELLLDLFGHGPAPPSPGEQSVVERFERGDLDTAGFYEAIAVASGLRCGLAEFRRHYGDIFTPIEPMIAQHKRLREAGVPTYLLSNTSELHMAHCLDTYPFLAGFDGYILSYVERSYKPEEQIYRAAERETGLAGSQLLFIDDKVENVEGARSLSWHAIHHRGNVRESLEAMAELGLPVIEHPYGE